VIEEIHIRDLGIITDARLPLEPGFSVLTGETGVQKHDSSTTRLINLYLNANK